MRAAPTPGLQAGYGVNSEHYHEEFRKGQRY